MNDNIRKPDEQSFVVSEYILEEDSQLAISIPNAQNTSLLQAKDQNASSLGRKEDPPQLRSDDAPPLLNNVRHALITLDSRSRATNLRPLYSTSSSRSGSLLGHHRKGGQTTLSGSTCKATLMLSFQETMKHHSQILFVMKTQMMKMVIRIPMMTLMEMVFMTWVQMKN